MRKRGETCKGPRQACVPCGDRQGGATSSPGSGAGGADDGGGLELAVGEATLVGDPLRVGDDVRLAGEGAGELPLGPF